MKNFLLIFGISLFLFSCNMINNSEEKSLLHGGVLRINETEFLQSVNPNYINNAVSARILSQVFEGLVKYDPQTLKIIPSVAKNWTVNESKDEFVFNLRTNVFFHESKCFGKKNKLQTRVMNATDVKYSIEKYCLNNKLHANNKLFVTLLFGGEEYFEAIKSDNPENIDIKGVVVKNDSTIIFKLGGSNPLFLNLLANPGIAIVAKECVDAYGDKNLIGTGPFVFQYVPQNNETLVLKRNANYYLRTKSLYKLPYLDALEISFISSTQQEVLDFKTGKLDIVANLPKKFVNQFLEENIDMFQSKPPVYILQKAVQENDQEIYNLFQAYVKGFYTNEMNIVDYTRVYIETVKQEE